MSDVPVTDAKIKLQCLDLSSLDHPSILIYISKASQFVSDDRNLQMRSTAFRDSKIEGYSQNERVADQTTYYSVSSLAWMSDNSDNRPDLSPLYPSTKQTDTHRRQTEGVP